MVCQVLVFFNDTQIKTKFELHFGDHCVDNGRASTDYAPRTTLAVPPSPYIRDAWSCDKISPCWRIHLVGAFRSVGKVHMRMCFWVWCGAVFTYIWCVSEEPHIFVILTCLKRCISSDSDQQDVILCLSALLDSTKGAPLLKTKRQ